MDMKAAYKLVKSVARPSDSEGLKKKRAILLLWFLRHVLGIDDLEAYEFVCDGDNDRGVDGLVLDDPDADDDEYTLTVFQSKYPDKPKSQGENDVKSLVAAAEYFETAAAVKKLLADKSLEPELRALINRFRLVEKLEAKKLKIRMVLVSAGTLNQKGQEYIEAVNAKRGPGALRCYDVLGLAPIIEAFRSPTTVSGMVSVQARSDERFSTNVGGTKVTVASVRARDIVGWPGIDDRRLFDLNVRQQLGKNRVRKALEKAVQRNADHPNFLSFHNGLTVVCTGIDDSSPDEIAVTDMSVVNGAQSTIAFKENESYITDELRVVVKFVQVAPERQLAREVAIRSNTQNPVNPRNLRARDGIQLRLENEFKESYPKLTFVTRPDASVKSAGREIHNDEAAQLISAIVNQQPWIAIRRLSLFEAARYPTVFTPDISAAHVVLVDLIAQRVQKGKDLFPKEYLRSWRLTKLVACYLVGQLLRASKTAGKELEAPGDALANEGALVARLDLLVKFAAASMKRRRDQKEREEELDDFKVDFKRESALKELAGQARDQYLTYETVNE